MNRALLLFLACGWAANLVVAGEGAASNCFEQATMNAAQAQSALTACQRYVHGWLRHADPETGLIPRNLESDRDYWNGKDAAADNYPFMVLTAWLTERPLFDGRMREMLATETRLTSRLDNLVDAYSFTKRSWHYDEPELDRMIFESSEYSKDGLMPLTEWLGPSAWSDRMMGMIDSIWKHARVQTANGLIPSDNVEVNGEMMQVTSRVYWMTGERRYLEEACRLADYFLLGDKHPTRDARELKLRDHGCELISGLTEVYVACRFAWTEKAAAYREPLHALLDRVLEVGVNEHGLMFNRVNPRTGEVLDSGLSDSWGYNYNGFYAVYLVDGEEKYRQAVLRAMGSLPEHYLQYRWEGSSADGIADAVEGAINLFNREPVPGVAGWIDHNLERMLKIQRPDGVVEGWHGDGNFARTAIMYALWNQQGVTIQPWRADVRLGAVPSEEGICLSLAADKPWRGRLAFDVPRHRKYTNLPLDYPRINQFPEWFVVDEEARYEVRVGDGHVEMLTGMELSQGWSIELKNSQPVQISVLKIAD
ncbi:MAG: hypothetical protein KDA57_04430 [Planctomycetales bacterium]|nr:hypothetical protein [Planctomycetales bacterium]